MDITEFQTLIPSRSSLKLYNQHTSGYLEHYCYFLFQNKQTESYAHKNEYAAKISAVKGIREINILGPK
jgi:hypothetical protein